MTIKETIVSLLERSPDFRERRFKDNYIKDLILERHEKSSMIFVDTNFLLDFAKDFETYNRVWRQCLQEQESLRGSDYEDGKALEQSVQIGMGYEVGFTQDKKLINKL